MSTYTVEQAPPMQGWPDQWYVARNGARVSPLGSAGEARQWARAAGVELERPSK